MRNDQQNKIKELPERSFSIFADSESESEEISILFEGFELVLPSSSFEFDLLEFGMLWSSISESDEISIFSSRATLDFPFPRNRF